MASHNKFLRLRPKNIQQNDYHHTINIINAVDEVFKNLTLKTHNEVIVCAEMQSGKTEVMKRIIYVVQKHNQELRNIGIHIDNIFVILCVSSKSLKEQLKKDIGCIDNHIFHLNDLLKLTDKKSLLFKKYFPLMSSNCIILFDECHCDLAKNAIVDKFRNSVAIASNKNRSHFYKVGFSATPYEQIVTHLPIVRVKPGNEYYGVTCMIQLKRVFQAQDLCKKRNCVNFWEVIEPGNFYYLFRLPEKKLAKVDYVYYLCEAFEEIHQIPYNVVMYDMSFKEDINSLLNHSPEEPTFVFVKEKLRVGEHLNTEYVHIAYDRPCNQFTHTTAQSFIGRCCGYGKKEHGVYVYCDLEKVKEHAECVSNGYSEKSLPSKLKNIKYAKGTRILSSKCLYNK